MSDNQQLPAPYCDSTYYQPFPYVEPNQHVSWTGPEYATSRWFDGARLRNLDANPAENARLQNQCVRQRGRSLKYRGVIPFAQLRVHLDEGADIPCDMSHVRSPEEKLYQENLARLVARIVAENSDSNIFPHPRENPLAYSLLPPLRHFYLLNRYDQFIRKDVGDECRIRERDGFLVGYHNVEFHKLPVAHRSYYYLQIPAGWRLFDVPRALQVPTPPSVSYLTYAIKRSPRDSHLRQSLWAIVSAEFAELAFHRFMTCARYGTDGQGGNRDRRLSDVHLPENTPLGRLLPISDELASLWYRMGIQNLVRDTEFSEEEAYNAVWRSVSTDWQDSPGFWWYILDTDTPVPMPLIEGITTDGRSYDYPKSRRPSDDMEFASRRVVVDIWRRDEPFSPSAYQRPSSGQSRTEPRAFQDELLGTENGFQAVAAFPAFDNALPPAFDASPVGSNIQDAPQRVINADETTGAEVPEDTAEAEDTEEVADVEEREEMDQLQAEIDAAEAEVGVEATPEGDEEVTGDSPGEGDSANAEGDAMVAEDTEGEAPSAPAVQPSPAEEEDEITPNVSKAPKAKKKLPLAEALEALDKELDDEESSAQPVAPVVDRIGPSATGRSLKSRMGSFKKRSLAVMRGKSPIRGGESSDDDSLAPSASRGESTSSLGQSSGKLWSVFRRKRSSSLSLTSGFQSTVKPATLPSPEVSEVVDLTAEKPIVIPPKKATKKSTPDTAMMPRSKSIPQSPTQPSIPAVSAQPSSILRSSAGSSNVVADEGVFTAEALFNEPRERDFVPIVGQPLPIPFAPVPDSAREPFDTVSPMDRSAANHALSAVYGDYRAYSLSELVRLIPGLCQKLVMQRSALELRREMDIRALDAMEVMAGMAPRGDAQVRADVERGSALLPARVDRGLVGTADPMVLPVDREVTVVGRPIRPLDVASAGSSPVKEPALKKAKSLPKGVSFE